MRAGSSAAAAYFCMTFLPELSAGNAAYSLLQTLRLSFTFALLLPFCMFSGDILLRPRPDSGAKGFIFSAALTLALYFTLALGLDRAVTRVSFSLISVAILALYLHSVSFLLRSRGRNMTGPAFFQALTMALIFTEGMQIFLYN